MHSHFHRQFGGAVTLSAVPTDTSALNADPNHTGTSGLVAPTIIISSTVPVTTSTVTASATSSISTSSSSGKLNTGAIIGLAVGIFALLAVALIVFMTVRHKKRRQGGRPRAISAARKSWSRLNDDREPAQLQMRATNLAKTASIAESNTRTGEDPFQSHNSTRALILNNKVALPSGNPFLSQEPSESGHAQGQAAPAPSRSVEESHIPNPFTSPRGSPSHSPSASHTSTYSSHGHSVSPTAALTSFAQHTPQYGHASTITASSYSEHTFEFPLPPDEPSKAMKAVDDAQSAAAPAPARLLRKQSSKEAGQARSRELRAMQDLISALDERAQNKKTPPSAFDLRVNTSASQAKSRLSMGEGLVTPGGHSIREADAVLVYDDEGNPYWIKSPSSTLDHENFPLPPAEVFRAALSPGGAQGNEIDTDPFRK